MAWNKYLFITTHPCFLSWSPPPPPWVEMSWLWLSRWGVGGGSGPYVCVMRCVIIDLLTAHHPDITPERGNNHQQLSSMTIDGQGARLHLSLFLANLSEFDFFWRLGACNAMSIKIFKKQKIFIRGRARNGDDDNNNKTLHFSLTLII